MSPRAPAKGEQVEVRRPDSVRSGTVETVMPNKSGFLLEADGAEPRIFVFQ